jgi:hypothetical protein
MPRYIAIYKGYDQGTGLQQGKDYHVISHKEDSTRLRITVQDSSGAPIASSVYLSDWEFLKDWQILRTWPQSK